MDPNAHPHVEVATIKLADPDRKNDGFHIEGTRIFIENETVQTMLVVAYGVNKQQLIGMPDWFATQRFDIHGTTDTPGVPNVEQMQQLLQELLQNRLALTMHHDTRDMTRIVITVAHGGPKFAQTTSKEFLPDQNCGGAPAGQMNCSFVSTSMDLFATTLRLLLNKPIVNATNLPDRYDFKLKWQRDDAAVSADGAALPGLLTAMQEQIGIRAESSKGPTDVLVIDHAERPSDN